MFSSPGILEYHRKLLNLPSPREVRSADVDMEQLAATMDMWEPFKTAVENNSRRRTSSMTVSAWRSVALFP